MLKNRRISLFDIFNTSFLLILAAITIFPLYNVIIASLTTEVDYFRNPLMLFPKNINLDSYIFVITNKNIINAMMSSLTVTIGGTLYSMFLTVSIAYVLTKIKVKGIKYLFGFIIFTMFFNGGLIPYYMLVRGLGLIDSLLSIILPLGINTFYMIIVLSAFRDIPASLEEAAKIDGANDIYILFRIIIPVTLPTIMSIILFYSVDKWNEWYNALLFLKNPKIFPLTYLLRSIVIETSSSSITMGGDQLAKLKNAYTVGIQKASIMFAILPVMLIYPFMQRYFTKGIMIGAIKG